MGLLETLLGVGAVVLVLIIILLIAGYIFWLWMFIDALKKRDTLWIVLFIFCFFTGFLGGLIATIYWFVEYKK
jgi:hypothetical protein